MLSDLLSLVVDFSVTRKFNGHFVCYISQVWECTYFKTRCIYLCDDVAGDIWVVCSLDVVGVWWSLWHGSVWWLSTALHSHLHSPAHSQSSSPWTSWWCCWCRCGFGGGACVVPSAQQVPRCWWLADVGRHLARCVRRPSSLSHLASLFFSPELLMLTTTVWFSVSVPSERQLILELSCLSWGC